VNVLRAADNEHLFAQWTGEGGIVPLPFFTQFVLARVTAERSLHVVQCALFCPRFFSVPPASGMVTGRGSFLLPSFFKVIWRWAYARTVHTWQRRLR